MKRIIIALLCLGSFGMCSCLEQAHKESRTDSERMVGVTLSVIPTEQDIFTRATDENVISDVNLYLTQGQTVISHFYSPCSTLSFECPAGEYTIFLLANLHEDTGYMDYHSLRAYPILAASGYEDLPMAAQREVKIEASEGFVLPPIVVERIMARIRYTVAVSPDIADMEIRSVQAMTLPALTKPFDDFGSYPNSYTDGALMKNTEISTRMSGEFYMLPNPQGNVPKIIRQADKNAQSAPAMATYLRIRALRGNKVLDYSVYLGENATDDFNVRSNTAHTYNILILNDNEADVRIRSYTIDARCRTAIEPENGIHLSVSPITLSVSLAGKVSDMNLSCELELISGNKQFFSFEGTPLISGIQVPLPSSASVHEFVIRYLVPDFKIENAVLRYRLNFYDKFGYVISFDFSYCYAKRIQVYTKWHDSIYGNGYGTITSPDAFKTVRTGTLSSVSYLVYCPDEGCTLVAEPDPGRTFIGWFREYNGLGLLGETECLNYTPLSSKDTLYANIR